jgi:hypothetical protein
MAASQSLTKMTDEVKEQIKKVEDGIVAQITKYNDEIKAAEIEEGKLQKLQTRAYLVSEKYRKSLRSKDTEATAELESELSDIDSNINGALNNTLEATHTALVTLQALYKDHVDYLSKVAKGLKERCEALENDAYSVIAAKNAGNTANNPSAGPGRGRRKDNVKQQ